MRVTPVTYQRQPAQESTGSRRAFLFLQGPASRAFNHIGHALAARGHRVHRINFHAGDQLFWTLPGADNYRGSDHDWPAFLEAVLIRDGITEVVLFGDCRPRHRAAVMVARRLQLPVHVFEEGYIRPHWVTLELGGVNGHSSLPRDPDWYRDQAAHLAPVPPGPPVPSSFARRATEDLAYNFAYMLGGWMFPSYRTHRPWNPMVEYVSWAARLVRRRVQHRGIAAAVARADALQDFYVFPLQLDCDSQVRTHSPFNGLWPAIEAVMQSFARGAPPHTTLLIKEHPLDNGMKNWNRMVQGTASALGISGRVCYIEDGDLDVLTRRSLGMVTINSTSGTLALAAGVPITTMGDALYDINGLTFRGELDAFWTDGTAPDPALFQAFRRVLAHRSLVRGGFFSDEGVAMLTEGVVARLEGLNPAHAVPAVATQALAAGGRGAVPAG